MGRTVSGKLVIIIFLVLLISYAWAWKDGYNRSHRFYQEAMSNLKAGRVDLALKGTPPVSSARIIVGGFQQAMDIWGHPLAWPRPAIYQQSQKKVDEIIKDLSPDQALDIFEIYFQQDNRLLPEILLQLGHSLEAEQDYFGAKDAYLMLIEVFALTAPEQVGLAQERVQDLDNR